jgi:hypothetical protein
MAYLKVFATLMLALAAVTIWLWNPGPLYSAGLRNLNPADIVVRFVQQFFSPWTGLHFCLPVLLVLLWNQREKRKSLLGKSFALCGCAVFFSLNEFFNGDVAGGCYIFPFVIALLPDIAAARRAFWTVCRAPLSCCRLWFLPSCRWRRLVCHFFRPTRCQARAPAIPIIRSSGSYCWPRSTRASRWISVFARRNMP